MDKSMQGQHLDSDSVNLGSNPGPPASLSLGNPPLSEAGHGGHGGTDSAPAPHESRHSLHHGDCLEVMATLPPQSIDMVLCDLPYKKTQNPWDVEIPLDRLWATYRRVCKPNAAIVLTASQPFTSLLVTSNLPAFRHEWVWEKNKASGHLNAKRRPMRAHEDVLVFSFGTPVYRPQMTDGHEPGHAATRARQSSNYGIAAPTFYGGSTRRYPRSVQRFPVINNDDPEKWHPTQKPVALFEYLIRTYSDSDAIVLDNAMGSGTTGVACRQTGRRFVGIEKDTSYFERARTRLTQDGTLFASPSP